jgi:spore maturation protein CgeB
MCGALYLTQHNPELALVFEIGKEIVTYRDESDCAKLILELLADPERAAAIRRSARARCLRDHTYTTRWLHVMQTLGALVTAEESEG